MKALTWVLPTLLAQLPMCFTTPNCPLFGPEFPPPQRLSEHPTWKKAVDNVTAVFDYIDASNITGIDRFSYSIQIFSINPGPPILWERHRTAKDLPANTTGVKQVDRDTVYRLGSVSKAFTVLAFLAEVGDVHWNQPITKYIPELAKLSDRPASADFDSVRETDWDDITIGALASQVSGLGRDCELCKPLYAFRNLCHFLDGVLGEIMQTEDIPVHWKTGFAPLSNSSRPPCGAWPLCTRKGESKNLVILRGR
jgi:hypothetical protein